MKAWTGIEARTVRRDTSTSTATAVPSARSTWHTTVPDSGQSRLETVAPASVRSMTAGGPCPSIVTEAVPSSSSRATATRVPSGDAAAGPSGADTIGWLTTARGAPVELSARRTRPSSPRNAKRRPSLASGPSQATSRGSCGSAGLRVRVSGRARMRARRAERRRRASATTSAWSPKSRRTRSYSTRARSWPRRSEATPAYSLALADTARSGPVAACSKRASAARASPRASSRRRPSWRNCDCDGAWPSSAAPVARHRSDAMISRRTAANGGLTREGPAHCFVSVCVNGITTLAMRTPEFSSTTWLPRRS